MNYTSFINALFAVRVAQKACQHHLTLGEAVDAVAENNLYQIGLMVLHLHGCEMCRSINIPLGGEAVPLQNYVQFLVFATAPELEELATALDGGSELEDDERLTILRGIKAFSPVGSDEDSVNRQIHILMAALGEDLRTRYSPNGMTLA